MTVKRNFNSTWPQDILTILGLEIACHLGCTKEERAFPQVLTLNIDMVFPMTKAAATDNLKYTVDYARLIADLKDWFIKQEFLLLETLAVVTAKKILKNRHIIAVGIHITKKALPGIGTATVSVWREK
jgi:FolB domain-containing protein